MVFGSGIISGSKICGIKLIRIVPVAIIKFAHINPNPYKIKVKRLLAGVFEIPNDQKKKMALSSHGSAVWRIPKRKAGANTTNNGGI